MHKLALVILSWLAIGLPAAHAGRICYPSTPYVEFCRNMKHLGSSINALDSQPALMRIDPAYLNAIATEISETAHKLTTVLPPELSAHFHSIEGVKQISQQLRMQTQTRDLNMLVTANNVGRQCLSCHTSAPNQKGTGNWNEMFGNSWKTITNECAIPGKNPYLCKTMNAMATNYNTILTGYLAERRNFNSLASISREVLRLVRDLGANRFEHLGPESRLKAERDLMNVIELAQAQDARAFEGARDLHKTCMACHDKVGGTIQGANSGTIRW